MVLLVAALLPGGQRGPGRDLGDRPQDRPFLVEVADAPVLFLELNQPRRDRPAIGAAVVEELDDGHVAVRVPADRGARIVQDFVAPSQDVAVVRQSETGERELVRLRWGLIPFWAKDEKIGYKTIDARAETVAEKPAFRAAFRKRRCLIPASGFYEWQVKGGDSPKQPFYITGRDGVPLTFAGLWESWEGAGQPVESCTIMVTAANDFLKPIHDRMPVIVAPEDFNAWLDLGATNSAKLLRPCPDDWLVIYPVSTRVNNPKNDDSACIEGVSPGD